jgi:ATP/maltotriose-dependent transcriptional regulator MalT
VAWARRALMRSHSLVRLYGALARNHLATGDLDAAEWSVHEAERTERDHGLCMSCHAVLLPEAIRVALLRGRTADAQAGVAALEEFAGHVSAHSLRALAALGRARVLAAAGEIGEARAALHTAHDESLAAGDPYGAARCLHIEAQLLRETSAREAAALEAEATGVFTTLGAAGIES